MPARHITGKQCTVTYGTLDASAQVTSVGPDRTSSSETTQTLGDSVTIASEKEISIALELLFDPTTTGISALLHAAWVDGGEVGLEIDYGGAVATYAAVKVTQLGEAIPADGLVTQTATFNTGQPDTFTWATPTAADEEPAGV